jgi:hypothetical protein
MIRLLAGGLFVVLGFAITIVIAQVAPEIDGSTPMQSVTGPKDPAARKVSRTFPGHSDDTAETDDSPTRVRSYRRQPTTPPMGGVGTSDDQPSKVTADHDVGAGTETVTIFGLSLPHWVGTVVGGTSAVAGSTATDSGPADPTSTTTPANSGAAGDRGCNRELQVQPQGVTAQVDFVGLLLDGEERAGQQFSGTQLSELTIRVQWQSLFRNHRQRLDFIAPDGSLYQSLSRPLTAADADAPVETRLPVNGTWITRYGLYGAWCVEAFLDQEGAPVASSRLVLSR